MIQMKSVLDVADNTGAKLCGCIQLVSFLLAPLG